MPIKTYERAIIAQEITRQIKLKFNEQDPYIRISIDNWDLNIFLKQTPGIETGKLIINYKALHQVIKRTRCLKFFHPSVLTKIGYKIRSKKRANI